MLAPVPLFFPGCCCALNGTTKRHPTSEKGNQLAVQTLQMLTEMANTLDFVSEGICVVICKHVLLFVHVCEG